MQSTNFNYYFLTVRNMAAFTSNGKSALIMMRKQRDRIENFTMVAKVENLMRYKKSRINLIGGGTRF